MISLVLSEHIKCFRDKGYIEFEDILTEDILATINQEISAVLAKRMSIPQEQISLEPEEKHFFHARDIWRDSPFIKSLISKRKITHIASGLTSENLIRLGYDQVINPSLLEENSTIEGLSSLQNICCGILILLPTTTQTDIETTPFYKNKTNILFFDKDTPLPTFNTECLLVVYTQNKSIYRFNPNDHNFHFLKTLGYNFGDIINDKTNPVVHR